MPESAPPEEPVLEKENQSLKQKVDELERTLSEMELNKSHANTRVNSSHWWEQALFVITVFINIVPAYFVVQNRWFEKLISIRAIDELWWSIIPLRTLGYPRYFLIIFLITVVTVLIVFFWRSKPLLVFSNLSLGKPVSSDNQVDQQQSRIGRYLLISALVIADISAGFVFIKGRIPGWELLLALALYISGRILMEYPMEGFKQYLQKHGRFLLDTSIFIIALCSVLYTLFGESKPNFVFYLLFIAACINFLRYKKEIPIIFWVSVASLVALTWRIDGWEYVVIGDEYNFYNEIRNILENRTTWQLVNNTFNGNFVYGTHPYFSSYIHNFFMKLFGNHNFGWRFSNPFLVAASLFFFYYFFKAFIPRRTALITAILLGVSHYLLSFSKIGYNNLQALFALGLILVHLGINGALE